MICGNCGGDRIKKTTDPDGVDNINFCLDCGRSIHTDPEDDENISPFSWPLTALEQDTDI